MRVAILGSGAVGGYYGALLARDGHDVTFIARGAHLEAIRQHGLSIRTPLGDFIVRAEAHSDPSAVRPSELVILAVKTYSNPETLPMLAVLTSETGVVLPLQNGVDAAEQVAAVVGERRTLGGATYVATQVTSPGVITQTGTHRRIVLGEMFGERHRVSERAAKICEQFLAAGIQAEAVPDAAPQIWEKFIFLSPFAGFTGASRLPLGPLWANLYSRSRLLDAFEELAAVARASGISVAGDVRARLETYLGTIPPTMRSSLLMDLERGKPIEVEALQGSAVRRGRQVNVPTPIMDTLYAVLKPHEHGQEP